MESESVHRKPYAIPSWSLFYRGALKVLFQQSQEAVQVKKKQGMFCVFLIV